MPSYLSCQRAYDAQEDPRLKGLDDCPECMGDGDVHGERCPVCLGEGIVEVRTDPTTRHFDPFDLL
jgi:DnaJ-class molecular chaperone